MAEVSLSLQLKPAEVLRNPADPILDWETVKHELLSYGG